MKTSSDEGCLPYCLDVDSSAFKKDLDKVRKQIAKAMGVPQSVLGTSGVPGAPRGEDLAKNFSF
jgi:hypothetical protein